MGFRLRLWLAVLATTLAASTAQAQDLRDWRIFSQTPVQAIGYSLTSGPEHPLLLIADRTAYDRQLDYIEMGYAASLMRFELDCPAKKFRSLGLAYFDRAGAKVGSTESVSGWLLFPAMFANMPVFERACDTTNPPPVATRRADADAQAWLDGLMATAKDSGQ